MTNASTTPRSHPRTRLLSAARFAREALLETLWPTRCCVCDAPGHLICPACAQHLRYVDANRACRVCGSPFGQHQCTECNEVMLAAADRERFPLDGMATPLLADDAARRIVTIYKDANERRLSREMAQMMARCIPPEWRSAHVTFIPATAHACRTRGFDHAELLAREVSSAAGMEMRALLERPRSRDQRSFGKQWRMQNMQGCFLPKVGTTMPDEVVLVDDICTTGATLHAAADCLRSAGIARIFGLAFAKVLAS